MDGGQPKTPEEIECSSDSATLKQGVAYLPKASSSREHLQSGPFMAEGIAGDLESDGKKSTNYCGALESTGSEVLLQTPHKDVKVKCGDDGGEGDDGGGNENPQVYLLIQDELAQMYGDDDLPPGALC